MNVGAYGPILVQLLLAIALAITVVVASHVFGQKTRTNPIKDSAYECGLPGVGEGHPRFAVKFFVTALLFILFDVEMVFLVPWALIYRDFLAQSIPIFVPGLVFLTVIVAGLYYEIKKGALEWEK